MPMMTIHGPEKNDLEWFLGSLGSGLAWIGSR
jgi:hypothetical protein